MSGGNFASLTDCLLVRKGKAKPPPMTASETSPFAPVRKDDAEPPSAMASEAYHYAHHVVPAPLDAAIPRPPRRSKRRELPAAGTESDVPATPRRAFVLSENEYEALGFVADKKGTTRQDLLRKMLRNFLVAFVEQDDGCRY